MSLIQLNLGSGNLKMEGWTSVDKFHPDADVHADLFSFPWPWADDSVDAVAMFHFLEHVRDLDGTVLEVHRILKPGGKFWVIVPHAHNTCAYDIDHHQYFTSSTLHTLCSKSWYHFGGRHLFEPESFRMPLFQAGWLRWTPLDEITRRWPRLYEKFMPIAPAIIEWVGRKPHPPSATGGHSPSRSTA